MTTTALSCVKRRHVAWMLEATCELNGERNATRVLRNGAWEIQTYNELRDRADRIAAALIEHGVQRGDRVALFSNNRPEWTEIDMAVARVGAIMVPVYSTSTVDQIVHMCEDSGAVVAFAGARQIERMVEASHQLPQLRKVVALDPYQDVELLGDFLADELSDEQRATIYERMELADPSDVFSLTYTSGTTGAPKGVMITHGGMFEMFDQLSEFFTFGPEEHSLCFLPLAHALERGWSTYLIGKGCMNTYLEDTRKVAEMLVAAKPTLLVSVPKLYETVLSTARNKVKDSRAKRAIFNWALRVGGQMQKAYSKGRRPLLWWRLQMPLADKLLFSSVRNAMGGPKKVLACGGAPVRPEVEEFFSACGLQMYCGYGMTEASPLISFNRPDYYKTGTVGPVMPGSEIKVGAESEILFRGKNVMAGYWNAPEATAEVIDEEGWLHTGDAGYIDNEGFLVITDRLKDIIVTIGGKNVAPQPIESLVLTDPLFEQAILLGDNRQYLTMLVKPSTQQITELAEKLQISTANVQETMENNEVVEEVRRRVAELTAKVPRHEQIRDIRLLWDDFTMENGLLTPSMKVRRHEVEKQFRDTIEDMYAKLTKKN